jgi:hypothetical protein
MPEPVGGPLIVLAQAMIPRAGMMDVSEKLDVTGGGITLALNLDHEKRTSVD